MSGRASVLLAGAAALLPVAVAGAEPGKPAGSEFVAPATPLILTRTLRRPLPDGAEIASTRRYAVRITPEGAGFRVDGRLLAAEVAAPPSLGALAEIERNRADTGLFPFQLDRQGLIIAGAATPAHPAPDGVGDEARLVIASSSLSPPDRQEAEALLAQLLARGAVGARWPADLFRPQPGLRSQTGRIALPGGQLGSVTTTIDVRRDGAATVVERTVITETGGNQRLTRETYSLVPGAPVD